MEVILQQASRHAPEFVKELTDAKKAYFRTKNIKETGNWKLYSKTIILFGLFASTYYLLVFTHANSVIENTLKVVGCVVLGGIIASIGFNVMHDANHGSYTKKDSTLNYWMGLSLNFLGADAFLWIEKHNKRHHISTNIHGHDEDIEAGRLLRFHRDQEWQPIHRYQHVYAFGIYCLLYLSWVWGTDYKKYFSGKILSVPFKKMSLKDHVVFWISKVVVYPAVFILIPIIVGGFWQWVIGYIIVMFTCSLFIAVIFQMAHVVEEVDMPTVAEADEIKRTLHQISTTANFGTRSTVLNWICGGLNFQVEHHLWPTISHVHYPALNKILKEKCKKFNITYHEFPTLGAGIASHIRLLKELGKAG